MAFRAVFVHAGKHVVEFRFRPGWILPGLVVSALFLAAAAAIGMARGRSAAPLCESG